MLALHFTTENGGTQDEADLALDGVRFDVDDGLRTAILISLYTDRRADPGDILPGDETELGGWWGDAYADVEGDKIGSKLWLLRRSVVTDETLRRAESYCREALQWTIDDGLADRVEATAAKVGLHTMTLGVGLYRAKEVAPRFSERWRVETSGV